MKSVSKQSPKSSKKRKCNLHKISSVSSKAVLLNQWSTAHWWGREAASGGPCNFLRAISILINTNRIFFEKSYGL